MTDTSQDPNYQDILNKYAQSLQPTESNSIPEPESIPTDKPDPQTQLDAVPETTPVDIGPEVPPTVLEPDPAVTEIPDSEPQSAVMVDADTNTEVNTQSESVPSASSLLEADNQVIVPEESTTVLPPETPIESQLESQPIEPPQQFTTSSDSEITPPEDTFVPPAPHPIGIAPDFVPPPKESHLFKYLFFFSLFIFIIVLVSVSYTFISSQKTFPPTEPTPTVSVSPTDTEKTMCEINEEKYAVGESFNATDGCNTCTCNPDLTIACTEMSCEATKAANTKLSPTKAASSSAGKKLPTTQPTKTEMSNPDVIE